MNQPFADELISAYLDGELSADEQALVEQKLNESAELRQMYEELRLLRGRLQSLPVGEPDGDLAQRVLRRAERVMLSASAGKQPGNPAVQQTPSRGEMAARPPIDSSTNKASIAPAGGQTHIWTRWVPAVAAGAAAVLLLAVFMFNVRPSPVAVNLAGEGNVADSVPAEVDRDEPADVAESLALEPRKANTAGDYRSRKSANSAAPAGSFEAEEVAKKPAPPAPEAPVVREKASASYALGPPRQEALPEKIASALNKLNVEAAEGGAKRAVAAADASRDKFAAPCPAEPLPPADTFGGGGAAPPLTRTASREVVPEIDRVMDELREAGELTVYLTVTSDSSLRGYFSKQIAKDESQLRDLADASDAETNVAEGVALLRRKSVADGEAAATNELAKRRLSRALAEADQAKTELLTGGDMPQLVEHQYELRGSLSGIRTTLLDLTSQPGTRLDAVESFQAGRSLAQAAPGLGGAVADQQRANAPPKGIAAPAAPAAPRALDDRRQGSPSPSKPARGQGIADRDAPSAEKPAPGGEKAVPEGKATQKDDVRRFADKEQRDGTDRVKVERDKKSPAATAFVRGEELREQEGSKNKKSADDEAEAKSRGDATRPMPNLAAAQAKASLGREGPFRLFIVVQQFPSRIEALQKADDANANEAPRE